MMIVSGHGGVLMYRLRRRNVRLAIVTVLVVVAAGLATVGVSSAAPARCASVQFVGARGSNEPAGLGATLRATYDSLVAQTNGIKGVSLDYPAAPVPLPSRNGIAASAFVASVNTGVDNLRTYLTAQAQRCPAQRFVLAGYSQGAIVVDRVLPQLGTDVAAKVVGVVLFGDPRFQPGFVNNRGTFDPALAGVDRRMWGLLQMPLEPTYVPPGFESRTASYCLAGDLVCNYSITNQLRCSYAPGPQGCPHGAYISSGLTREAAAFLSQRIGQFSRNV